MGVNKVTYGGDTLIDLTGDTVSPSALLKGVSAHDSSGEQIEGEFDPDVFNAAITDIKTADYGAGVNLFDFDAYADAVNQANNTDIISNNGDNTYSVADIRGLHIYYKKYGAFKFSETDVDVIFSIKLKKGSGYRVYVNLFDSSGNIVASGNSEDEEGSITLQGKANGIVFSFGREGSYTFIEPIIRPAAITDDTFYPYIKTNKTLTEDVAILPENAKKNYFNLDALNGFSSMTLSNGVFTQTDTTDTKAYVDFSIVTYYNGNPIESIASRQLSNGFTGIYEYPVPIKINSSFDSIRVKHNGSSADIGFLLYDY